MFKKIAIISALSMMLFFAGCTSDEERAEMLKADITPILKEKGYELISLSNYDKHPKHDNVYANFVVKDPCGERKSVKYIKEYGYIGDMVDDTHYISFKRFGDRKRTQEILDNFGLDILITTKVDDDENIYTGKYRCGKSFEGAVIYEDNMMTSNKHQLIIKLPIKD